MKRRGMTVGIFLLLNAVPLVATAYVAFRYWRGEVAFKDVPPGLLYVTVGFGAGTLLLGLLCWGLFPMMSSLERTLRASMGRTHRAMARGVGPFVVQLPAWLLKAPLYAIAWASTAATSALIVVNALALAGFIGLVVWMGVQWHGGGAPAP
ncbi:MAG: hypothetical protein A3F84_02290 [Candidatus Handelsmanbacteria bacterium RIFCSPLOWO2_12_FULL_64_10]|uniref:Uncharacterized protein n=1 Tax=Handelsmanbacteria sp. (strain RIFCSPLOWO2_12_FULL_64_10) TaxID=1817868 RepID=A0A1F6CME2_HANXR|nr:MAG: hypothetical protein A3F84_02290 [Candidatus Handelsmanbacteria bacterium RIFCSPLOWO2_12_FULL_64_10]